MHEDQIEDATIVEAQPVNFTALGEDIKKLAKLANISQAKATTIMGYAIKLNNKVLNGQEAFDYVNNLIKTKGPEQLDMDERLLCITLGVLKRKVPFIAAASKIGRNEPCPCKSGAKYKNCCLEMAKEHDYNRFYGGSTPK